MLKERIMFNRKKATRKDNLDPVLQPDSAETFGQYIRRLRLIRGIKLSDFSRATARFGAQVSQIELSHIELGLVAYPSIEHLTSLAKGLDIPPQWLIEKSEMSALALKQAAQPYPHDVARQVTYDPDTRRMILSMIEEILRRREIEKS